MLTPFEAKQRTGFEHIYDKYSSLLYGIILKFSSDEKEAESILIKSFKSILSGDAAQVNTNLIYTHILRITIGVISEHTNVSKQHLWKIIFKDVDQKTLQLT